MWAHYAQLGTGLCLGFDDDALIDNFDACYLEDVTYSDKPGQVPADVVEFAFGTEKRRHTLRMMSIAHRLAYFVKRTDWQYEQERRLVVRKSELCEDAGGYLADISPSALKYVIVGQSASKNLRLKCMDLAARLGASIFEFRKARTNYAPYFSDLNLSTDLVATWEESTFRSWENTCASCREPARALFDGLCEWCSISEAAADSGARRSMLTLTLQYGIDDGVPFEFDGLVPRGKLVSGSKVTAPAKAEPNTSDLPF